MTIRENILENIKSTLETIRIANSYANDIASVQRWLQKGNTFRLIPCIIINAGPEEIEQTPNPLVTCKLTIYLDVFIRQEETDTISTDALLNSLLGDIEKALMVDYTRGGFAENTNIKSNMTFEAVEGQPNAGIVVELEIIYQHLITDPEQSG